MKMHFTEGITVTEAAEHAGVERTHFSKLFLRKFGVSPKEYLESLVMKEAERMVGESSYSISEIALSVGFPDLYSFSKAFKRNYGISPTVFRESRKQE
jgi:AraC-like DNA-binding protein